MGKKQNPQTRSVVKEDKGNNKILLIGAAVGILVVVILIVLATTGTKKNTRNNTSNVTDYAPNTPNNVIARNYRTPKRTKTRKSVSPNNVSSSIKRPETPEGIREIYANAKQYLKKYDSLAAEGQWLELAKWATRKGLFVESYYAASAAGYRNIRKRFYRSVILVPFKTGYSLVTQAEFEKTYTISTNIIAQNYKSLADELNEIKSAEGIAAQTRLADLLIKIDTPNGRNLFRKYIKDPKFYSVLVRELERTYLSGFSSDNIFQAKWYSSEPMNLWLIRELIALDVSKISPESSQKQGKTSKSGKSKRKRKKRRARRNRNPEMGPPMGPMGPMEPGMQPMPGMGGMYPDQRKQKSLSLSPQQKISYEHKKLLLNLLVRRGGILSAYLIGELLQADKDNLITKAIIAGQISPALFMRFTGIYAEPLISPFEKALLNIKGAQADWNTIAAILANMHNDRAAYAVFLAAKTGTMHIQSDVAFSLAAQARPYTLDMLTTFITAKQIDECPIESLFTLWTVPQKDAYKKLWNWLGEWIPGVASTAASGDRNRSFRNMRGQMPQGPELAVPAGQDMPGEMMPGPMAPEGQNRSFRMQHNRGRRAHSRTRRRSAKRSDIPEKGWPIRRTFIKLVNKDSALTFLEKIGQIPVEKKKQQKQQPNNKRGRRQTKRRTHNRRGSTLERANPIIAMKKSAIRCLLNVATSGDKAYFTKLIDDDNVGGLARLGLCVINDKDSCEKLLAHFWTHPLELADFIDKEQSPKENKQSQIIIDVNVSAGKLAVPLNEQGLTECGISARSALIYFDYSPAGKAFLSALGEFILHKDPFDEPARVAGAVCQIIEAIGNWNVPDSVRTLADLIASAGDFGLRGSVRHVGRKSAFKPSLATSVRAKALEVLGRIGDKDALNIIIQLATFPQGDIYLQTAARIALARRGTPAATELFLDMLDPDKAKGNKQNRMFKNASKLIPEIAPDLKTEQDVALLGISRLPYIDPLYMQRAIELIKKLGQVGRVSYRYAKTKNIQERYVLSLLSIGQGSVIEKIADLIEESASEPSARRGNIRSPFYWNKLADADRDKAFLFMIKALSNKKHFDDPDAVVRLIKAILKREQEIFQPDEKTLNDWDPEKYVTEFEYSSKHSSNNMLNINLMNPEYPGMEANMPDISKGITRHRRRRNSNRLARSSIQKLTNQQDILSIKFPPSLDKKQVPQRAVAAGLELITTLPNAKRYVKEFNKFPLYRYHANFIFAKKGFKSANKNLSHILANPGSDKLHQYFAFLAIDQMIRLQDPLLIKIFGQAASVSVRPIIIHKIIDGGTYIITQLFKQQVAGETSVLDNKKVIVPVAEPWQPVISTSRYDSMSSNPLVIMLAGLQLYLPTIDWIDQILVKQCKDNIPISEQAVIDAITILHKLNPAGNEKLLNLYLDIIRSKFKQQARAEKHNMLTNTEMQSPGKNKHSKTFRRSQQYSFAYNAACPLAIKAIGDMTEIDTLPALKKLVKERADMLGFIALEIYKKDPKTGKKLILSTIKASGKEPAFAPQVQAIMAFLLSKPPTPFCYEALAATIIFGDSSSANFGLSVCEHLLVNKKFPKELDVPVMFRSILQGLVAQIRTDKNAAQKLEKTIELAKRIKNPELKKVIANIEKYMARMKRTTKSGHQRGRRRTLRRRRHK